FGMFTHLSFAHAATTAIYTLSLHDALPIFAEHVGRQDVPTILAGDFNVKEDAELALLEETILTKAASAATFPSWKPTKALDHLFFSHHFELSRVYAFDRYTFSDHLPLVVELKLIPRRS